MLRLNRYVNPDFAPPGRQLEHHTLTAKGGSGRTRLIGELGRL